MTLFLNQDCFEPSLKKMPHPIMPLVEALRIDTVQLPHANGKISLGSIDQQMVMVLHQTVGVAEPIVAKDNILKDIQEDLSIQIVSEYLLFFVSSARDVINSTWKLNA
jgi:hypothetical protein